MQILGELRHELRKAVKVGVILALTNASSFATVAMERHISNYTKDQAAFANGYSGISGNPLYALGTTLGHKLFYGEDDTRTLHNLGLHGLQDRIIYH